MRNPMETRKSPNRGKRKQKGTQFDVQSRQLWTEFKGCLVEQTLKLIYSLQNTWTLITISVSGLHQKSNSTHVSSSQNVFKMPPSSFDTGAHSLLKVIHGSPAKIIVNQSHLSLNRTLQFVDVLGSCPEHSVLEVAPQKVIQWSQVEGMRGPFLLVFQTDEFPSKSVLKVNCKDPSQLRYC